MRFLTQLLVIMALVTAGISPACAFVGAGKAMMEICASDGSVKRVAMPDGFEELLPTASENATEVDGGDGPDDLYYSAIDQCVFCMFQSSGKTLASAVGALKVQDYAASVALAFVQNDPDEGGYSAFSARAPPYYS